MTTIVYTDDPDAHWSGTITSTDGSDLDWTPVQVAAGSGAYDIAATWLDTAAPSRRLKVPLATLEPGHYTLYLKNPTGNDYALGVVAVLERS